jgi:hypothetical protein
MSSAILSGGATGTGTYNILAPSTNNNQTLTLPDGTGTLLSTANPQSGGVIQVVQGKITAKTTTSSTSYVTSGLTATITPKFSNSKILVLISTNCYAVSGTEPALTIYRNGSNILGTSGFTNGYIQSSAFVLSLCGNYLDSPASTSAQTYTLYYANAAGNGATLQLNFGGFSDDQTSTITLMEIAA